MPKKFCQVDNLILIYTGHGKGKTTAALGLALRALRDAKKVILIQFIKSEKNSGERKLKLVLPNLEVHNFGNGFISDQSVALRNQKIIKKGIEFAKKIIKSKKHQVIILDEILVACHLKLVSQRDIIEIIRLFRQNKPGLALVLTGRGCPKSLYQYADLVTEMKEIKHPFQRGKRAVKGVDY